MAMLPPFASLPDFEARLGRTLAVGEETARAEAALADASAIIRAEAGVTWASNGALTSDLPDSIVTITLAVARRVFDNPQGLQAETESLGGHSHTEQWANASTDVYLKASERAIIAKVTPTASGIGTLSTTRGDLDTRPVLGCDLYGLDTYDGLEGGFE